MYGMIVGGPEQSSLVTAPNSPKERTRMTTACYPDSSILPLRAALTPGFSGFSRMRESTLFAVPSSRLTRLTIRVSIFRAALTAYNRSSHEVRRQNQQERLPAIGLSGPECHRAPPRSVLFRAVGTASQLRPGGFERDHFLTSIRTDDQEELEQTQLDAEQQLQDGENREREVD
ncbi:hypothetical protein E4U23_007363 [Claviceps purpurea]|nr:hypothetical protein E4U23_007363 [Claviceps purpurea]KAG6290161.1 hypothetical protein E4U45_007429 [Claviceps purpurea]